MREGGGRKGERKTIERKRDTKRAGKHAMRQTKIQRDRRDISFT